MKEQLNPLEAFRNMALKDMDPAMLSVALAWEAGNSTTVESAEMEHAIAFASLLHENQFRRNRKGSPKTHYIEHPLRVALRLIRMAVVDRTVILAALLHDTAEDGGDNFIKHFMAEKPVKATEHQKRHNVLDYIRQNFGVYVADMVEVLSNPIKDRAELAQMSVEDKRAEYLAHIENAVAPHPVALLVKFSDWMDNGAGLHHNFTGKVSDESRKKMAVQAAKYLPVADIFLDPKNKDAMSMFTFEHKAFIEIMETQVKKTVVRLNEIVDSHAMI